MDILEDLRREDYMLKTLCDFYDSIGNIGITTTYALENMYDIYNMFLINKIKYNAIFNKEYKCSYCNMEEVKNILIFNGMIKEENTKIRK